MEEINIHFQTREKKIPKDIIKLPENEIKSEEFKKKQRKKENTRLGIDLLRNPTTVPILKKFFHKLKKSSTLRALPLVHTKGISVLDDLSNYKQNNKPKRV